MSFLSDDPGKKCWGSPWLLLDIQHSAYDENKDWCNENLSTRFSQFGIETFLITQAS